MTERIAAVTIALAMLLVGGKPASFPGEMSELPSPDGRFVLANVDSHRPPHHVLYLREKGKASQEKLLAYERHVSALWSPDGRRLLVNDYSGSDSSNCLVFVVAPQRSQVDIREELRKQLGGERSIFDNHHVYIEGVEWLGSDRVKVKVSGYGDVDPKGFTLLYEYPLGGAFGLLTKTPFFSRME